MLAPLSVGGLLETHAVCNLKCPPSPVRQLGQDGEYAGNDAIVAFSRAFSANVMIHQLNCPRWEILAPPTATPTLSRQPPTLHVAYLNGEHYCSVRPLTSDCALPHPKASSPANSVSRELMSKYLGPTCANMFFYQQTIPQVQHVCTHNCSLFH